MAMGFPDVAFVKLGAGLAGDYQQVGLVCIMFPKESAVVEDLLSPDQIFFT